MWFWVTTRLQGAVTSLISQSSPQSVSLPSFTMSLPFKQQICIHPYSYHFLLSDHAFVLCLSPPLLRCLGKVWADLCSSWPVGGTMLTSGGSPRGPCPPIPPPCSRRGLSLPLSNSSLGESSRKKVRKGSEGEENDERGRGDKCYCTTVSGWQS